MPFDYLRMVLIARGKERKLVVEICLFFFFFSMMLGPLFGYRRKKSNRGFAPKQKPVPVQLVTKGDENEVIKGLEESSARRFLMIPSLGRL